MQGYEEIFRKRGRAYHKAMEKYPNARNEEFETASAFLEKRHGSIILDLPAGGGYLKEFLPREIDYLAYDFSGEFDDQHTGIKKCKESKIELESETVDEVMSLAALHHIVEREAFYSEMFRILKPNGKFTVGDVIKGSRVDPFLNEFLDRWNSMGHQGRFIEVDKDREEMQNAGFTTRFEEKKFYWNFSSEEDAMRFFRQLFFLDLDPPSKELRNALEELGTSSGENFYKVEWSLGFFLAEKINH